MSKTPFELRFETLTIAREHLFSAYAAELQRLDYIDDPVERSKQAKMLAGRYPDTDDILECAEAFRAFVDNEK